MTVNRLRDRVGRGIGRAFLTAAFAASAALPSVWGFAEIAGGSVNLDLGVSVTSDSNIRGDDGDSDDVFYSLSPTLSYSRARGRGTIDLSIGTSFNRYADFDFEDSDDWSANASVKLPTAPGAKFSGTVGFTFFDGKQVDDDLEARVSIRTYNTSLDGVYQLTPKTGLRFGIGYGHNAPEGRAPNKTYLGRLGVSFPIRPQLNVFVDYQYTKYSSDFDVETERIIDHGDSAVNFGLDGNISITGKLTGSLSMGFQTTDANSGDVGDGEDQLVAAVNLNWQARPRTSVGVTGQIGTQITNSIETYESRGIGFNIDQHIGQRWDAAVAVSWMHFTVRGMGSSDNDRLRSNFSLSFAAAKYFSINGFVSHYIRWAPDEASDIERTTVGCGGTFTF